MPHDNATHTKAASAYGATASNTDQRVLEGQVLLIAAQKLEDLAKRLKAGGKVPLEEIDDTLTHNRKLWELFLDGMTDPGHLLPQEIKNNVASLAVFVFKRTLDIMVDTIPEKFDVLISINRNIAAGLMKKQPLQARTGTSSPYVTEKPPTMTSTDSMA